MENITEMKPVIKQQIKRLNSYARTLDGGSVEKTRTYSVRDELIDAYLRIVEYELRHTWDDDL